MPRIVATATAFPEHYHRQDSLTAELVGMWGDSGPPPEMVERLHRATTVEGRHIGVAKETYKALDGWELPNALYLEQALELGSSVVVDALNGTGLAPGDISHLIFASTTGISVPSIDARLMNRLPFPSHLKRLPVYGLGCAAGAAGVARLNDYLKGHPTEAGLLVTLELCSLTIQKCDTSIANVIACGLFGDGAAAVVMVGNDHPLAVEASASVVDSESVFFPESEHYMGWHVRDDGLEIMLSADVPAAAVALRQPTAAFLERHGLSFGDIDRWICHPGGPRVIDALEEAFGLQPEQLHLSRAALRRIGNISSASVLVILDEVLRRHSPSTGEIGLMTAMGPGFAAELILLQW